MSVNTLSELNNLLNKIDQDAQVIEAIANDSADSTASGPSAGIVTTRLGSNVKNIQKVIEDLEATLGSEVRPTIQEEGSTILSAPETLNFVGSAVTVTDVAGVATITIAATSPIAAQDDGTPVVASTTAFNFTGPGVSVADAGSGVATVNIPGAGLAGIVPSDLGFSLSGNPVDGDDGAVLALLLEAVEDQPYRPVRIQFATDNVDSENRSMYINSTVNVPSGVEIDFGNMVLIMGPAGRVRFQGRESEIRPGDRVTPTPTGELARLASPVSAGATSLFLDLTHPSSQPTLFNVDEYLVIRGENDAAGNSLERDIVQITAIDNITGEVTFTPALENAYQVDYPLSEAPVSPDRTTISIKESFLLTGTALPDSKIIEVPASAVASIQPGDWVQIEDATLVADQYPDTTSSNKVHVEIVQVRSVDATPGSETIELTRNLLNVYEISANATVTKVNMCENAIIKNATVTYAEEQTSRNFHPIYSQLALSCRIENIHVRRNWIDGFGHKSNAIRLYESVGCTVLDCSTLSPFEPAGGGESYGMAVYYSYGCFVHNFMAQGCRHSLLLQCASRNIVTNFVSHDCSISDIDLHGINEHENVISNFTVVSGPTLSTGGIGSTRTGVKVGNTTHLAGSFNNIIQNGIVRLSDDPDSISRGIEILPSSFGNVISNIKILNADYGILMTDQSRSSDGSGPDANLTCENNTIRDIVIGNTGNYAIQIDSADKGATNRVVNNLALKDIEIRDCEKGINITQTNRVQLENITIYDQGVGAQYAAELNDNTNLLIDNFKIINGNRGIIMIDCDGALINNVLFDLTGTVAINDAGNNNNAKITNLRFKSDNATHDFSGGSVFAAFTNAERATYKADSAIATDTEVVADIPNDSSNPPLVTEGIEIVTFDFNPISPATTLDIEVIVPSIVTDTSNEQYIIALFDGSTCIGVMQHVADSSGAAGNVQGRLRVVYPITGYTTRTFSARFGPRDAGITMTLYSRWTSTTLGRPYMIINDLGLV